MRVLDASVIIKWFTKEEDSDLALDIRQGHINGAFVIAVPDLLFYEITNVLATKTSFKKEDAKFVLENLLSLELMVHHLGAKEFISVLEMASKFEITAYDSAYIVLAEVLGCTFITADGKLREKVRRLSFVKSLGKGHFL